MIDKKATPEEIIERVRDQMQKYVDNLDNPPMVNAKQVLSLLSPTWPDGDYCK